jgi:hypothetical protein
VLVSAFVVNLRLGISPIFIVIATLPSSHLIAVVHRRIFASLRPSAHRARMIRPK